MNFSTSEENYIKGIYHLQKDNNLVNTNSLASGMNTSAASVTDMLKKLKAKKLLQYERYRGFRLNDQGKKVALGVIRKHRLWEYFLFQKLGFAWDKVHPIAEQLEHVGSDELVTRLDRYLGNPSFDPHGDPIPDRRGRVPAISRLSLTALPLKQKVSVSAVGNQTPQMLELLRHCHIGIGTKLMVTRRFEFDGSLEIKVLKKPACIVSEQVAKNVFVQHEQQAP
jgi:DtxR family transcriptional regulator, Mn-dependent transcriptional regulator